MTRRTLCVVLSSSAAAMLAHVVSVGLDLLGFNIVGVELQPLRGTVVNQDRHAEETFTYA